MVEREKRVDGWRMYSKPKVIRAHAFFVADVSYCLNGTFDRITFRILSITSISPLFHPNLNLDKIICTKRKKRSIILRRTSRTILNCKKNCCLYCFFHPFVLNRWNIGLASCPEVHGNWSVNFCKVSSVPPCPIKHRNICR